MELQKQIRDNAALRRSFNALAKKTFGISFEGWYQDGCWSDSYLPYALTEGDVVVANAAVNRMDFLWQGQVRRYIQIGTVMTDSHYRNRGLSRRLITEILHDWQARCDGVFLFANDTVLDFYPKFGFSAVQEFQHRKTVKQNRIGTAAARRLSLDDADDRRLFEHFSRKENPFAALQLLDRYGLTMFHSSFWKDCIYYAEAYDAVLVAEHDGSMLLCCDIFGGSGHALDDVLSAVMQEETEAVRFGFTPKDTAGCLAEPFQDEDTTLFVLDGKENLFADHALMFPLLSHA